MSIYKESKSIQEAIDKIESILKEQQEQIDLIVKVITNSKGRRKSS